MRRSGEAWLLENEADTERLGRTLAAHLQAGEAVCLSGPLGAGKSVLARALVRALSPGERDVPSPTYTLVQSYDGGRLPIAHFDLYRLRSAAEARELGLAEALETGAAVIEWPERLEGDLPLDRVEVTLEPTAQDGERLGRLVPCGAWKDRPLEL